jgi:hypothetical protein
MIFHHLHRGVTNLDARGRYLLLLILLAVVAAQ